MAFGFFDGQTADASPESIKRKREMIAQLLRGNSRAPQNVGEGFNAIGNNIAAAITNYRANQAEQASNASSAEAFRNIYSGFGSPTAAVGGAPVATGSATGSGATGAAPRASRGGPVDPAVVDGIIATAQGLGVDPADLLTSVSYETGGTFNPKQLGPRTQWGQHKGLIQFGEPQARQHGVDWNNPIGSQLGPNGAIASYLRSTGVKPGMGLLDIYSAINAGGVGRYNRSDAHNGGAPGTVRDKVERQMEGHRARAMALLQGRSANQFNMPVVQPGPGAAPMPLARQQAQTAPMPNVASVQGDNPQQLLADAAYYERNGNVEAARQMRARAAMAGQAQMASAGPQGNEGQMPDGAGELQAGGSGLMGVGFNPAAPPDMAQIAGAQGFADNEEQTRAMEAQMAADQGLPYAGNEPGLLSPVPMGFGPNPFLPRDMVQPPDAMAQAAPAPAPSMNRATFDQVTAGLDPRAPSFTGRNAGIAPSWGIGDPDAPSPDAQEVSVRPARDTVSLPAANRQPPQSPAMRAPLPVDMGGENSGGSAMQFIESEFARREGRPDPRMAIGAPQGYNPFGPQALQAPQMAGDGGSVQGASQGGEMASGAAQAPAQANSRIAELASIAGNPMVRPEVRQLAMAEIQTERARALAEAERARVQAQNEAAADALKLDRRLANTPAAVSAQAGQMLNNEPAKIAANVAAREAEGRRLGLQGSALQNFALTGQMPVSSQDNLDAQVAARKKVAEQSGLKPGDPRYEAYVLTGNMPRQNDQPLSVTDRKIIVDAEDSVINFDNTISVLARAKELNPKAYSGLGAGLAGKIGTSGLPGANLAFDQERAKASREFNQLMSGQAIEQMAQTLKGATTEFELKQFVEILGDPSTPPDIRGRTIDRMMTLAQRQRDLAISRAKDLRNRDYFNPEGKRGQPSAQTNTPDQSSAALQNARKAIADGAPRQAVIDRLRQAGIDPGGL